MVMYLSQLSPVPSSDMQYFCFKIAFNMEGESQIIHCETHSPDAAFYFGLECQRKCHPVFQEKNRIQDNILLTG